MAIAQNEQLDLALNFVQFTNKNLFLTGKAGTGKTTFLHNLKKSSHKRMAVVAPTGVAAINAGGVTIHSFFQLPFGPHIPGNNGKNQPFKRFNKDKINLIRSLDLLVIDEISMVRADTLDGIDETLRRYRDHSRPFGGIQLLMIGDLHQLSPVVKEEDWKILKDFYPNLYFFSSSALLKTDPVSIELKHIYRQSDTYFIDILNSVRDNQIDDSLLTQLNQRYIPNFNPGEDEGYITLTTHNRLASEINEVKLAGIKGPVCKFTAIVKDEFPEYAYPTVEELELKIGAQVMFVKNDPSRDKLFYNGKIGKVTKIDQGIIYVKCPEEYHEIAVEQLDWENIKYELNTETKEVEEKVIGSFTQYPLKLAWAITIHKSQGLTFEKAIIDANAAFAHGQVYVALSRCKTFEGMVLSSPIVVNSVKTDGTIAEYTKNAGDNAPTGEHLTKSKIAYQQSLIYELFDFSGIKTSFFQCRKIIEDNYAAFPNEIIEDFNEIRNNAEKEIYQVAESFKKQLANSFAEGMIPEENAPLQDRIKKAGIYFNDKTNALIYDALQKIVIDTDNKAVKTSITDALRTLQKEILIKLAVTQLCTQGFDTQSYLKTKANTEIDLLASKTTSQKQVTVSSRVSHPELYTTIKNWRDSLAEENNLPVYLVLPQKTLIELVRLLPSDLPELGLVKGMGKIKVKQYGEELMTMINTYCREHAIDRNKMAIPAKEDKLKPDTKKVSFDLYKSGKTIQEIASERQFTRGTIEGHLSHFILSGELSVFDIVSESKVAKIMNYIAQNPKSTTSEMKAAMGDDISYGELKAVNSHLEFTRSEVDV